ncbi:MAG: non-heme iron oxygenase ferredoxin subunit [Candidatus Aenigmarchaeota archaeon]|nr:non-heme iron oxygenase ferredoxin subunit [Candidatus Aenigmarchaeota archaeon]
MAFIEVARLEEIKPGSSKAITARGHEIALHNVAGRIYATTNTCPHRGGPLGEGFLAGDVVTCPWHGWQFSVETGQSPVVPSAKIPTYKVKVEGDKILVEL